MYEQMTLPGIDMSISSPASGGGRSRSRWRGGPQIVPSGPAPVPANPLVSPASGLGSPTLGTSGPSFDGSSPSDALQRSLENRLRQRLTGSVSCDVTWRKWITPWGQSLFKPRARVRTISGIAIGLWPTATAVDGRRGKMPSRPYHTGVPLSQIVVNITLGLWPTATASDHKSRSASQATLERNARPLREIVFAMWSTLRASDGEKGGPNQSFGAGGSPLPSQISTICSTSNVPTENGGGSLHPEFAGWEMGYPPEWLNCAPLATPSIHGPRPRS